MTSGTAPGRFITFEGGEGAGKSTQIRLLASTLRAAGHDVVETREPGGSPGAEAVRHVLLSGAAEVFGPRMEAVLFAAARSDHVDQLIGPGIAAGRIVLCDRFIDSSRVYQGVTGNLEPELIRTLERIAVGSVVPDLTILIDIPAEAGLRRARRRNGTAPAAASPDRFEKEDIAVHENRRQAFLDLAEREPGRFRVVDGDRPVEAIAADIAAAVDTMLTETAKAKEPKSGRRKRAGGEPRGRRP